MLAKQLVCRSHLNADVQCHQCVVHGIAHGKLSLTAADDLGVSALRQIHLIFNQFHHRLARRQKMDCGELMLRKNRRNFIRFAQQSVIIGACGAPDVQPCGIVLAQQSRAAFLEGIALLHIHMQGEPPFFCMLMARRDIWLLALRCRRLMALMSL